MNRHSKSWRPGMKIMNKCVDKDGTKDYQVQAFSREKSSKLIQY
ncbi:MAG: hypothetical protein QXF28_00835 [Nitrososphaerota archaeon]